MSGGAQTSGTVHGYAVVDVETTGILPSWHHRVAEIAVIHVDPDGTITDEWSTLVNPDRDLGPQAIHGIRAADVRRAPPFEHLAGEIIARLAGRVIVAHNWPFDAIHLHAEFGRCGLHTPWDKYAGLCTMQAATLAGLAERRSLIECCAAAGLSRQSWHTAWDDAMAAAELLGVLLRRYPASVAVTDQQMSAASWVWPPHEPRRPVSLVHRTPAGHVEPHFLARLVERVPRDGEPDVDVYLAVLDRALLDRHLSATETDELLDVAHELGLHRSDVVAVHIGYLRELARAAWADRVVTADERDVEAVAALLGLDVGLAQQVIEEEHSAQPGSGRLVRPGGFTLRMGDKVVLTGDMTRGRDDIIAHATAVGIRVTTGVSKQTTVLVAADPDSLSGKAKKARQLAIPVVSEAEFLAVLDGLAASDNATATSTALNEHEGCGSSSDTWWTTVLMRR